MKSTHKLPSDAGSLVLGLDIGAASIGWAFVERHDGKPQNLKAAGARAFDPAVKEDISAIRAGRDTSRAAARREARLRRRMLARRRHRLTKLALILQRSGLLPPGDLESGDALMGYFARLDRELFRPDARRDDPHLLPYHLRSRALDERLEPYELGRAVYHLAHRRGFLSNRRVKPKPAGAKETDEEKEQGRVKTAIGELAEQIHETGARTLGEYLSRLDPEEKRVRNRYLGRQMLKDEFEAIWVAQAPHHPDILTDDLKKKVHNAIFFQRPLKSQRHLVGQCELERRCRRAPLAALAAQRFRVLQKVNDLKVFMPDGEVRDLTPEERTKLVDALEHQGDLRFGAIRKLLDLPRRHCRFNFETEGEKGLIGNRTACKLREVFGEERWQALSLEERDRVVEEIRSIHNRDALKRRAMKLWSLDEEAAGRLSDVALEDGYCNLSRQALAKMLPLMEKGMAYASARKQLYGDEPGPRVVRVLPRVQGLLEVRNPTVERALTELRKVVNAIVREHGKPDQIRIELAREMKKTRKDRKDIHARNAANRRAREAAAALIMKEAGITKPRRSDTEKWLLAEECNWQCPYTGKQISAETLFGDNPQFDVEHIVPFHRCLDNSFFNKTLCDIAENRRKGNRTPWEAYGGDEERWAQIIERVKGFNGRAARAKLERFQIMDVNTLDDFTSQQLNDTRYASRLAVRYVGLLYGAGGEGVDPEGKRRVEASRGAVTSFLRDEWQLNFLGGGEKTRDDHRQHAIDAIVVALTTPATIKGLSDAAARAPQARRRRFAPVEPPWPGFLDDVRAAIDNMVVSHRVSRKVAAALHEETIYSKPCGDENGKPCVHIRRPLQSLAAKDVDSIVDPAVRECVKAKLDDLGEKDPKKAFRDAKNHPSLRAGDGRQIPIHKARIRVPVTTKRIGGEGAYARRVKLGSNHHVEILQTTDKRARPRWEGVVVSTYEAMRRLRAGEAIVQRDHGAGKQFKFSLAGGEIIELNAEETKKDRPAHAETPKRELYVVRTVTMNKKGYAGVEFASTNDARKKDDIKRAGDWGTAAIDALRKRGCRKVVVTPLGEVRRAGD